MITNGFDYESSQITSNTEQTKENTSDKNDFDFIIDEDPPIIDIDQGFSRIFTGFGSLDPIIKPKKFIPIRRFYSQPIPLVRTPYVGNPFFQLPMVSSSLDLNQEEEVQTDLQLTRCWKV